MDFPFSSSRSSSVPDCNTLPVAPADWIVPAEENAAALEAALTAAGNAEFEIVVFPGADHGLETSGKGRPPDYWEKLLSWLVDRSVR